MSERVVREALSAIERDLGLRPTDALTPDECRHVLEVPEVKAMVDAAQARQHGGDALTFLDIVRQQTDAHRALCETTCAKVGHVPRQFIDRDGKPMADWGYCTRCLSLMQRG